MKMHPKPDIGPDFKLDSKAKGYKTPPTTILFAGLIVFVLSLVLNGRTDGKMILFIIVSFIITIIGGFKTYFQYKDKKQALKEMKERQQKELEQKKADSEKKREQNLQSHNTQGQNANMAGNSQSMNPHHQRPMQNAQARHHQNKPVLPPTGRRSPPICPGCQNHTRSFDNFCSYCGTQLR